MRGGPKFDERWGDDSEIRGGDEFEDPFEKVPSLLRGALVALSESFSADGVSYKADVS